MRGIRLYSKIILFIIVTISLAPFYLLILLLLYRWREAAGPGLIRVYSRICLSIFRVRIEKVRNYRTFRKRNKGILIVANHASFLDIFVLAAVFGTVFVSKSEVKHYPLIGRISQLAGVLFFDRSCPRERTRLLKTIARGYPGRVITVFPQGTTGSIADRLPFNRGIFKVVELNGKMALLPVTVRYKDDEYMAWSKPQSLRENALRVCALKTIPVKITVHDFVTVENYRGRTPSQICKTVEQVVSRPLQEEYGKI